MNIDEPYRKNLFPARSRLNLQGRKAKGEYSWHIEDLLQTTLTVMQWDGDVRLNFTALNNERQSEVVLGRHDAQVFYEALGECLKATSSRPKHE